MIKVTKQMVHDDLKRYYRLTSLAARLGANPSLIKLINRLSRRSTTTKPSAGLHCSEHHIPSRGEDHTIRAKVFAPENPSGPLPLVLYIHGGGYVIGKPEDYDSILKRFVRTRPCVVIAPDYRKAYTQPYPAALNDCYDALLWARDNATSLNIDANNIVVAGHSAGGGLTAAVTLRARDSGEVPIAFQMPIYPMIDDTQPNDPERNIETPVWNTSLNRLGWSAYLADLNASGKEIPSYAAPARNDDYRNFPPTFTFVGDLEPFYWETENYVAALRSAGVEVEYRVFAGCFHGFDLLDSKAGIGKEAMDYTFDSFGAFYDRYITAAS